MQIVINTRYCPCRTLDDECYISDNECYEEDICPECPLIRNGGTVLPKGHGKIADIDKVLEEMKVTRTYDIPFALGRVKPIIEADTESEEEE